jgi:cathepsin L
MFKFVTALAAVVAMASAEMTFEDSVKKFNKGYKVGSSEWREHASIFAQEVQKVRVHNERPNVTYKRGINKFSDMTTKERGAFFGFNKNAGTKGHKNQLHAAAANHLKPVSELPASVDWRDAGIVTPVKDQGHCGSCWAFAATAVLESHVAKESGLLFSLSPQQISSCSPNPEHCGGTGGCEGATAEIGFDYAASSSGLYQEFQYPYNSYYGEDAECMDYANPVAAIDGYVKLAENNYTALMNAVANFGPIAVSVDASDWSSYEGGIFDGCNSVQPDINHAVTLVGYGECEVHGKYWLIRNSWSPAWGESGYMKLRRDDGDEANCAMDTTPQDGSACAGDDTPVKVCGSCGVLYDTSYPTGAHAFATDEERHP